jgi:hypothetical protein
MTAGGWPLAGKAHIDDDHSLAYSSFFVGVPPAWNVIRTEGRSEPSPGIYAYGWLPRNKAGYTRPGAHRALITERHPVT